MGKIAKKKKEKEQEQHKNMQAGPWMLSCLC